MGKFARYIPAVIGVVGLFFPAAYAGYFFAAAFVTGIAVQGYERRRATRKARDEFNAGLQDRLVMLATSDAARSRVYGRVRNVDGILFKGTHGPNKQFFTIVTAHAGHEIDAFEQIFFDGILVEDSVAGTPLLNASGYVQVPPYNRSDNSSASEPITISGGDGSVVLSQVPLAGSIYIYVSTGQGNAVDNTEVTAFTVAGSTVTVSGATFPNGFPISAVGLVTYNHTLSTSHARVRKYLGLPSQNISTEMWELLPALAVPGRHRFDNIALQINTFDFSPDAFPSGRPPNVTAVIRGARCTDPRTGALAWTKNSAVIALDWALYPHGGNLTLAEVDLESFIAAANACDVSTVFSTAFVGGVTNVTITIASPAVVTWTAHGKVAGTTIQFGTNGPGTLPTGLARGTTYWILAAGLTADAFRFSLTAGGSAVNTTASGSGTFTAFQVTLTTGPRYECSIVAKTDSNAGDVFEEIVASMAGQHGWSGGKLMVRAGAWRAPVDTITEDWISDKEAISIAPSTGIQDTYNILRPTISDKARDYAMAPVPQIRAEAYITADGQELPSEITLSAVTEAYRAQDICEVLLLEGRQAMTATLPCNMRAFKFELFDVVEVTLPHYGWTAKDFELRGWRFSALGGVIPLLREVAAASYDPATLFTLEDLADNTELPKPWLVDLVQGFAVASNTILSPDHQIVSRTLATWLPHTQAAVLQNGRIEIQHLDLGGSPQTVQWINDAGQIVTWVDDDGTGIGWVSGAAGIPILLAWENNLGPMTWTNDVEPTLEWYTNIGASPIPLGDWMAEYEPGGATSHQINALSPGHAYLFRARAINSIGVRSEWCVQIGLVIPTQPLVQTSGLEFNAATELKITPVPTHTHTTTASTATHQLILAATTYTNDTGGDVDIEFSLTSQRRVTTPGGVSSLDVFATLSVTDTAPGGFLTLVGPVVPLLGNIENMGASASQVFTESATWSITVADTHVIDASSFLYMTGAITGVVVETSNLTLRMAVVKR